MSLHTHYRLLCDFCQCKGPERDTPDKAEKDAATCVHRITRIWRGPYGVEVFACAACLTSNAEAKAWAECSEDEVP